MAELDRNLRDYIDGIAQPVTMNELATRPTRDRGSRRSPVYAVLAGAAIVLIPMLALLAITLWPTSEESADPAITTTRPPTTTTLPPFGLVAVPDLIGLDQASAVEAAVAAGFEVEVSERFSDSAQAGTVVGQTPAPGEEAATDSMVLLTVAAAPNCDYEPTLPPLAQDEVEVTVLFNCANPGMYPDVVYPAQRRVPTNDDPLAFTLHELVKGPTAEERAAGFQSFFGEQTAGAVISVANDEGSIITVDFNDAIYVNNASTSTGSLFFNAELNANVFQYSFVESVEYRINGSCEAWSTYFESDGCWVITRNEWEQQVAAWNAETVADGNEVLLEAPLGDGILVSTGEGVIHYPPGGAQGVLEHDDGAKGDPTAVASDGAGGFYLARDGRTLHYVAGSTTPIEMPIHPEASPSVSSRLMIVEDAGRRILLHFGYLDDASFYGIDLATGEPWREGVSSTIANGFVAGVGGRSVALVNESGVTITPDHYGTAANVAPDPTYLVVLEDEAVSHRIEVARGRNDGGVHDRVVTIEDFDGRRVIISRRPGEPAGADVTFLMVDLACPDGCLQVVVTQPGSAALTGTVDVSVPLEFDLDTVAACSAAPQQATPVDSGLPATVKAARDAMLRWAEICEVAILHDQAANQPTDLAFGRDTAGIVGAEALGVPALGQLIEALTVGVPSSFADDGGPKSYVWPGLADPTIDWSTMTDAEADRLAAIHGSEVVAEARSLGFYGGWYVIIDENGSWRFLGANAP